VDKQIRNQRQLERRQWQIVIARTSRAPPPHIIKLEPGQTSRFGVAIWEGGHQERGRTQILLDRLAKPSKSPAKA